jgi:hypothetical protein
MKKSNPKTVGDSSGKPWNLPYPQFFSVEDVQTENRFGSRLAAVMSIYSCDAGTERLAPRVPTPAALAEAMGVSRSTISDWLRRGLPRNDDGFVVADVLRWRQSQSNPPEDLICGTRAVGEKHREVTGCLVHALLRVLRDSLDGRAIAEELAAKVFPNATEKERQQIVEAMAKYLDERFEIFRLTEVGVERLLFDCATMG